MDELQAHERVINILVKQIFSRQLKPGDKLPPERQLAKDIQVDRASLRIALKHMELMNVLTIRQGDGIYVRDYMKGASIDFLRILFLQTEQPEGEWLVDPYIMDEIWEFWAFFLPEMLKIAAKRITPRDIKTMMDIFDEELANLHDRNRLIELELKSQEIVAETGNNIVVILITHTCRPLRKKMIEIFYSSLDDERIKNHIEMKKELMRSYMTLNTKDTLSIIEQYREQLNSHRAAMCKLLLKDSNKKSKINK
ncbi:MAG: FadR family transcriptional regulator [Syntrophaceae bacterium]|nr:FadR family transcriptional regulator [Syntrophaceae bacterium]